MRTTRIVCGRFSFVIVQAAGSFGAAFVAFLLLTVVKKGSLRYAVQAKGYHNSVGNRAVQAAVA